MSATTDPTLLAQMAASKPTRLAFGVLLVAIVVCVVVGAWFAGHASATEVRFAAIETAIVEARVERQAISLDTREVYTRLVVIETRLIAMDENMGRVRLDVAAIRDAVAPLPRVATKDGE